MLECEVVADGLLYPEGPVWLADGSIALVEVGRGTVTRVTLDGEVSVLVECGGGPNGLAVSGNTAVICNNGGVQMHSAGGLNFPGDASSSNTGGSIQTLDLASGQLTTLYSAFDGEPLHAPNDLVIDSHGGMWFTDHGHRRGPVQDRGGVYWAALDGSDIRRVIFPIETPNGIGLSPDGRRLYVAETSTARLWSREITEQGSVTLGDHLFAPAGGRLVVGLDGFRMFDSMAVSADGTICVATLISGEISVIRDLEDKSQVRTHAITPSDPLVTNLAFNGELTAITSSGTGRLLLADSRTLLERGWEHGH